MKQELLLSCAVITFNEEKRIRECIESVHEFCDEIVILDSNSTDKTESIAKRFKKVKFFKHAFDGHVQQKNRAMDLAVGKWLLSIDADERVTPELAKSIQEFIKKNPQADGARISRLTYHLGSFIRHGGWKNARYRLIRMGRGRWGGENPHDMIFLKNRPLWKANLGPVLKGDLIHYSFLDLSDQINTINKFSSIVAFSRFGKKINFSVLRLLYKGPVKFIEMYFAKAGFLDGMPGLIIALSSAFSAFLKEAKLYELHKTDIKRPSNLRSDYKLQNDDKKIIKKRNP